MMSSPYNQPDCTFDHSVIDDDYLDTLAYSLVSV